MSKILNIIWKDTLLRFSSAGDLLFFIILPVVFTVLLGGGLSDLGEDNRIRLLVVDEDGGALSAELVTALEASDAVQAVVLPREEAEGQFNEREAPALLLIPAGFSEALRAGRPTALDLRQLPNDNDALVAQQAAAAAIGEVSDALAVAHVSTMEAARRRPFASPSDRDAYFAAALDEAQTRLDALPSRLEVTQPEGATLAANAGFDATAHAAAGQLVTWVFIPMLGASAIFSDERTRGTFRRLLTTPTSRWTFLAGASLGQVFQGVVQMALLIGFGALVMGVEWGQAPVGLAAVVLSFSLAAVGLGVMLGTFIRTPGQANGLSIMLGMTMSLLGGAWFPLEIFPETARQVVQVLPTMWAMQGFTDIVIRGQDLTAVLPETAVLLGFAAVFFAIAAWRFRFE